MDTEDMSQEFAGRRCKSAAEVLQIKRQERWTSLATKAALVVIGTCAVSNFHPKLLAGGEESTLQQQIVIACWIVVIGVSYFRRTILRVAWTAGASSAMAFYAFALLSAFWSNNPLANGGKAVALGIVIFGAYRLARTAPFDDVIDSLVHSMFIICAASILMALFVPDIGVVHDWQHAGQWSGVFASKQSLGMAGAMALFLSSYRLMGEQRSYYHVVVALAALASVVGSGSRGGGALAAAAVLLIYLTSRFTMFIRIVAFAPFVMSLLGAALIWRMTATGLDHLEIFGAELDFTQRTFIWQHALAHFKNAPWLGYGLNGFWTLKDVKDLFVERHTWFLDNYHDGYIAIVMETGAIGFGLFVLSYFLYGLQISWRIAGGGPPHPDVAVSLAYTCMIFFIDFTETYFLRSTNVMSTFLLLTLFITYAHRPSVLRSAADRAFAPPLDSGMRRRKNGRSSLI